MRYRLGHGMENAPIPERMNAIIVSLVEDTTEMVELSRSMNYHIENVFIQRRRAPNPKFFVGKGKVEEIAGVLGEEGGKKVEVAIVNSPLKPTQIFHLQNAWGITVYDRTRLILEIFSNRARSQEARLQVELARLEYEVPLVKELIHRSKMGEHPGYMAGGEYRVDQYYEMIRRRIKTIKVRLQTVKKDRAERRRHRREEGFLLVSIAGYTNAGKSMLLKALTGEETLVEDRLFTTLFTQTRKGEGKKGGAFLFSDTVGFIRDLPPWLVDAFHSTLEEIFLADIVLLVVDISEDVDVILDKTLTSFRFLQNENVLPQIILAFNKSDQLQSKEEGERVVQNISNRLLENNVSFLDSFLISAKDKVGIEELMDGMIGSLEKLEYVMKMEIRISRKKYLDRAWIIDKFINWVFKNYIVLSSDIVEDTVSCVILGKKHEMEKLKRYLKSNGIDPEN